MTPEFWLELTKLILPAFLSIFAYLFGKKRGTEQTQDQAYSAATALANTRSTGEALDVLQVAFIPKQNGKGPPVNGPGIWREG